MGGGHVRRIGLTALGLVAGGLAQPTAHAGKDQLTLDDPQAIVNGVEVGTCGYPTAVGIGWSETEVRCSAVLVAPDVILTAAHCLDGFADPETAHFGEDFANPARVVPIQSCQIHPSWDGENPDVEEFYALRELKLYEVSVVTIGARLWCG